MLFPGMIILQPFPKTNSQKILGVSKAKKQLNICKKIGTNKVSQTKETFIFTVCTLVELFIARHESF